jgi:hypothetical protein
MALVSDGKRPRLAWLAELDAKDPPDSFDLMLSSATTEASGTDKAGSLVNRQPDRQTKCKSAICGRRLRDAFRVGICIRGAVSEDPFLRIASRTAFSPSPCGLFGALQRSSAMSR